MKKIYVVALTLVCFMTAGAQDAKILYNEAKNLDNDFNKAKPTLEFPTKKLTIDHAIGLMKAFDIYDEVIKLDSLPNAKGQIKPQYTAKIQKSLLNHAKSGDFTKAAKIMYENQKLYPDAYKAFVKAGETAREFNTLPDSIYAEDFYNAGISAFNGGQFAEAANAFKAARQANYPKIEAYTLELQSINNLAVRDSVFAQSAPEAIYECASEGVKRFGPTNDYLYSSYIGHFFNLNDYAQARKILDDAINENPNFDNLYRLRAMVGNAEKNYDASVPDFVKVGDISDNYEYLRESVNQLNRIGKHKLGQIEGNDVAKKAELRKNIFEPALNIAKKAKAAKGADGRIDQLIEDLEYTLNNNL